MCGNALAAVIGFQASLKQFREQHVNQEIEARFMAHLSEAQLLSGSANEAAKTATQAIELAQKQGTRVFEIQAQLALVRALLAQGAVADEIRSALARASTLVEETGARGLEPQIIEQRGRLAASLGDSETASTELEAAYKLYVEVGANGHATRLEEELGL